MLVVNCMCDVVFFQARRQEKKGRRKSRCVNGT
jgi:hypothetical protein